VFISSLFCCGSMNCLFHSVRPGGFAASGDGKVLHHFLSSTNGDRLSKLPLIVPQYTLLSFSLVLKNLGGPCWCYSGCALVFTTIKAVGLPCYWYLLTTLASCLVSLRCDLTPVFLGSFPSPKKRLISCLHCYFPIVSPHKANCLQFFFSWK